MTFAITHNPNCFDKLLHNILTGQSNGIDQRILLFQNHMSPLTRPNFTLTFRPFGMPIVCGEAVTTNPTRGYRVLYA